MIEAVLSGRSVTFRRRLFQTSTFLFPRYPSASLRRERKAPSPPKSECLFSQIRKNSPWNCKWSASSPMPVVPTEGYRAYLAATPMVVALFSRVSPLSSKLVFLTSYVEYNLLNRINRLFKYLPTIERPTAKPYATDDCVFCDGTEISGIKTGGTIIAQYEIFVRL